MHEICRILQDSKIILNKCTPGDWEGMLALMQVDESERDLKKI